MCGFVAILGESDFPSDSSVGESMLDAISHRGPDGRNEVKFDSFSYFGHVRLSILDIDNSSQPMISECGRYLLVFNGEIYNFIELRQKLIQKGRKFRSYGDTEVLLYSLIEEGDKCLSKLNGMFSFVFYDNQTGNWIAVRDHFGIKPLYYFQLNSGATVIASEIKALIQHPAIQASCNLESLNDYLTFQFVLGENTLFKGIKKLIPACYINGNSKKLDISRQIKWWELTYNVDNDHSQEWFLDRLKGLILDSIQLQTRSDVPIGSYLSGGIDSSLIAVLSSEYLKFNLPCFHGRFTDYPGFDESKYAQEIIKNNNLTFHEIIPKSSDFIEYMPLLIHALDEPLAGPGVFPQFMVSKLASQHVKVVLGGQGGDELFGGYARYLVAYLEQALKGAIEENNEEGQHLVNLSSIVPNLPLLNGYQPLMRKFWANGLFGKMNKRYFNLLSRISSDDQPFTDDLLHNFNKENQYNRFDEIFNEPETSSYINKMTAFDLKTLLPSLLQVEDRVSMKCGIEARVPILDYRISELVSIMGAPTNSIDLGEGGKSITFKGFTGGPTGGTDSARRYRRDEDVQENGEVLPGGGEDAEWDGEK